MYEPVLLLPMPMMIETSSTRTVVAKKAAARKLDQELREFQPEPRQHNAADDQPQRADGGTGGTVAAGGGERADEVGRQQAATRRRQEGHSRDAEMAPLDQGREQKHLRTHDRRHELPAGCGNGLDCACPMRRIADALHERDGEGPGGDDIGQRRARY